MRDYLLSFFREFAYAPEDVQVLLGAYDRITEDAEASALWQEALSLYDADMFCDYTKIIELADAAAERLEIHAYTLELLIFLCLTRQAAVYYQDRGLDEALFHNTMLDLRYKLEECKAVYGIVGSFVASWFRGFFKLTRFTFGRLQFEIIPFDGNYEKDGHVLTPESKVINIHIPRTGTPMDPESCDRAFAMAKEFFGSQVGETAPFVCNSWLLFPEHKTMLSSQSNTYQFLMRFDIIRSSYYKDRSNLWRLFDTMEVHPDRLPTDTSFRRSYVEHLKKGGRLGGGYGVFFL